MAMDQTIKNIREIMRHNKDVMSLAENAVQLLELNHIFKQLLPSKLANFCQIRSYRNGAMVLETSTGSAATQLRFMQPQLLTKLKKSTKFSAVQTIDIKIAEQPIKMDRSYTRTAKPVSAGNRQALKDAAAEIKDDALAMSMIRLADTLEKYGKD
ncbi:DUF721 domain-containing protein [Ketobacter sp. MCCC 1A13808]|uniref:DUF721 domain-containing protein n=1 Tax=Ketobacter sp. MCCC 1A13808 TaxID=2602738 RepID=UPI0012EC3CBA|nr:DUF721 domain-containing protein [Ketobacter sp. MCCC 1A13808]MVF11197.1 DUF721 domain-containing protein [Ketobacter sp. MCCC 1A13808]